MKINVPWWAWPWPQAKRAAAHIALNKALARELEDRVRAETALETEIGHLQSELHRLSGSTGDGALSSQTPDFVMVGIPRPGQGVRLWASRKLSGTRFSMTAIGEPPPRWKITAIMDEALTIDKPGYGEAMDQMAQTWRNWDAASRPASTPKPSLRTGQRQLEDSRAAKERWKSNLPGERGPA